MPRQTNRAFGKSFGRKDFLEQEIMNFRGNGRKHFPIIQARLAGYTKSVRGICYFERVILSGLFWRCLDRRCVIRLLERRTTFDCNIKRKLASKFLTTHRRENL
jgi:hypothetical protein